MWKHHPQLKSIHFWILGSWMNSATMAPYFILKFNDPVSQQQPSLMGIVVFNATRHAKLTNVKLGDLIKTCMIITLSRRVSFLCKVVTTPLNRISVLPLWCRTTQVFKFSILASLSSRGNSTHSADFTDVNVHIIGFTAASLASKQYTLAPLIHYSVTIQPRSFVRWH